MSDQNTPLVSHSASEATDRRRFLRNGAFAALAAGTLAACRETEAAAKPTTTGHTAPSAPPTPLSAAARAEEMDRMHEAGMKAFPAKTAGKGNQVMQPRVDGGVKVYELTASEIRLGGRTRTSCQSSRVQ